MSRRLHSGFCAHFYNITTKHNVLVHVNALTFNKLKKMNRPANLGENLQFFVGLEVEFVVLN